MDSPEKRPAKDESWTCQNMDKLAGDILHGNQPFLRMEVDGIWKSGSSEIRIVYWAHQKGQKLFTPVQERHSAVQR